MSDAPRSNCIRIEYEYADGAIYRAVGDDAEAIRQQIDAAFVTQYLHGEEYSGPQLRKLVGR